MRLEDLPEIDIHSEDFQHGVERAEASVAALRDDGPGLARSQRGIEVLRYDLATEILRDERFNIGFHQRLASLGLTEGPVFEMFVNLINNREGDAHERMRKSCASWFSIKGAERMRAAVGSVVDEWMDEAQGDGSIDFQTQIGSRLPAVVFCWLVGEPVSLAATYGRLSEDMLKHAQPPSPGLAELIDSATLEADERVRALIARRRAEPGDDLVSHMVAYEEKGLISADELIHTVVNVLIGSTDTTNAQICFNLEALAQHPDQWELLREQPDLIPGAVLECVRFNPGVWATSRSPLDTANYHGIELEHYDAVWPLVPSANRDPAAFDDPRRLDVTRRTRNTPLNFGSGRHLCLGRTITLMEQQEVVRSALERWSSFEVTDSEYVGAMYTHVVNRMTIDFEPADRAVRA